MLDPYLGVPRFRGGFHDSVLEQLMIRGVHGLGLHVELVRDLSLHSHLTCSQEAGKTKACANRTRAFLWWYFARRLLSQRPDLLTRSMKESHWFLSQGREAFSSSTLRDFTLQMCQAQHPVSTEVG
jgi:hypothetical protein